MSLTRTAVLVGDVDSGLCEVTILDCEILGSRKHEHGGRKTEQRTIQNMPAYLRCENAVENAVLE